VSEIKSGTENQSVQSQIEAVHALHRQTRIWRYCLYVAFVLVILINLLVLRASVYGLARQGDRQDQFAKDFSTRLQEQVLPLVQDVGKEALSGIDFNSEIDKLNTRAPEVANASLKEMRGIGADNLASGKQILSEQFDAALKGREAMLKKQFPDASEAEIADFLTNFTAETQAQLSEYVDMLFLPHLDATNSMLADLKTIEASVSPAEKTGMPTWEMVFLLSDIMRAELTGTSPDAPADTPPAEAKDGKEKQQ
jgi:hypothetical protein